ncbi:uncharacterized protein LOC121244713 isoform X2 [Juglans microcarpa x Juglans regia]|uniref:uncharacterized protein LOC121244713 isoform X2 n=1 Tax=Juglans microcarpa x Juglans regia TaxID=2249226 RepID=UPI001B7DE50F|nr:uncharacterized protein LOC121244713 isoform X2 [Juglans microcarpa x Juglans regia]
MEGFHSMKRKQLQALCKKHGVPANLTNREMADKLTLLLEEEGEPINKGQSCSKDLGEIGSANDSKMVNKNVKKVKFSPDNETFIFVGSESDSDSDKDYTMVKKRAGKRRSTVKLLSKKQVQVVDSAREIGVSGKNIDRPVRITRSRAQVVGGDTAPFVGKKRPRIGTNVESMEVNDVGFTDKPPADAVSVDGVAGVMKSQAMGRRGRRKTRNSRRNDGVVLLDDVSEDNVEEGAKQKKMLKPSRSNVTKEKGSSTLSTKMGKIGAVGRITRSRTQLDAKASAVDSGANTVEVQVEREEVLQLEEPLKGLGSKGLKKKSVGPQKARVKIDILAMEGPEPGKVLRRSKRNAAIDEDSEPSIRDLGKTKVRTRRAEVQIVEKASAVDKESESLADQKECEDGVRGPGRDASKQDLVVPQKGKMVSKGPLLKKETRKRLRNAGVEGNTGANPTVEPRKEHEKLSLPHGRPRRSNRNSLMLTTSAHMVGDMRNRETAGRVKQARESLQEENLYAVEEPLSSPNASRNDSIFISNADGARKVGRMKRRREPNPKGKGSVIESESSVEKSPRHSTHDVLKSDVVAAIEGPSPIVDTGSAVLDSVDHRIHPDSSCIKEISGKSMGKRKGSTRKSSAKKGLRFLEVSAVTSDFGEVIDTTTTVNEKVVPTPMELKGLSTDQCAHNSVTELEVFNEKENVLLGDVQGKLPLNYISEGNMDDEPCQLSSRVNIADVDSVKLEPLNIQSKVGSVVSSGNASPADCLLPLYQSYYNGEASNLSEMTRRRLETEEPLTGENMNLRNDKQDGQSDGDDQTSVQEDQHLQDANKIDKLIIHEIVVEDHPSELREIRCSNRKFKHTSETGQEISALDLFEGEEIDQVEILAGVTEMEQTISEANLFITETGEGKHGHSDIAATPLRPALESQAISKEVIANYLGTSSPKKDALEEEENQPGAQSTAQSTTLERGNTNHAGEEKYSSYGIETPEERICMGETPVSNAAEKMGTELGMTNESKNESLHSARGVPASGEELFDRVYEQNLRIDGGCLPILDGGVSQGAEKKESDLSDETKVTFLHELSSGGKITPIVQQETDTDRVENTSTSMVGLKCPAAAKEDSSPSEPTSLKGNDEQEGEGNHLKDPLLLSHNGRNDIESGVALLHKAEDSVLTTFRVDAADEKTEARSALTDSNDENPNDAAEGVVEPSSLLHFSLEESKGGNKSESAEVNNILDELLSPNIVGVPRAERSAEEKVTSGFDDTKLLEALNAVSCPELFLEKVFDDEVGVMHRNSNLKALDDILSSKSYMGSKDIFYAEGQKRELFAECSQQVELGDHRDGEVVGLASQSSDSGDLCDNFAKGEVGEFGESAHDDDSCGISAAVPDEAAHTVTMEKMGIVEAKLVGSLLTVSPVEQKKPYYGCGDEVLKIDASAVCTSNEVLPKDSEGMEETSSGVVLTSVQLDEVRFGNLDNQILEVSPELDGSASIGLDVLVSMDDKPADRVENFETVAVDEAGAECSGRKNDSEKVGDGAKLFEEALVSPHLFDYSSKWEEKEAENINSFADTSCGKYEIHPSGVIVSISSISSSHGDEDGFDSFVEGNSYDTEGNEMTDDGRGDNEVSPEERVRAQKNDGPVDGNVENSATAPQELAEDQVDGQNGAVTHADFNGIDCLTFNEPLRRSSVDETEEGLGFNMLAKTGVDSASSEGPGYAEFENSHVVTSEKSEVAVNHVVLPTVIALPSFATRALDSNDDSRAFTSWGLNLLLGGSEEDEVEKSGGVDSVANLLSTTSEDTEEVSMNVAVYEQIAEDQHGAHEQHIVEDVAQMVGSCLAVSDESISENDNESKKQGEVFAITQEHAGCENDEHLFIKVGISSSSIDTEITDAADLDVSNRVTAEETMAECGHNDSKQVQNNADVGDTKFSVGRDGSEHMVEAMEIDVPKIDATIEELSSAPTNMVVGREIDVEFVQTPQSKLESPKLKEKASLSVKQLNSSVVKGTKFKASLIPRTPKNLNMKENVATSKNDQIGNTTAARTMPKRRPLEDLQNN